jgi:hypothetical protein
MGNFNINVKIFLKGKNEDWLAGDQDNVEQYVYL